MSAIKKVAVVGAGTMGNGIAQVFAQAGLDVVMIDQSDEFVARGMNTVRKSLERLVKKGTFTEQAAADIVARITPATQMKQAQGVDLAVEAVPERFDLKKGVFHELDRVTPGHAILASTTSSISITEIAACTHRPDKVIGMHFMNPVPVMKLVEVIRGNDTSDATTDAVLAATRLLGKIPVAAHDYPGFISNRVLMPMINEAIFCLMEGVATRDGIDEIMKLGMNHPMGPLQLADFIGLDVCLSILEVLHKGLGDDKYRPCPLLRRMVAAGHLGKKTNRGFYTYETPQKT